MSEVPPGWTTTRLGDLGDVRLGKMLDKAKNQGLPTQYLRNINVRWFRFDLADLQMLLVPEDERTLLSVQDGDLFICEGGEPGRCAVWRNGTNSLVYQKALHRFRTSGAIIPELLMYRLRHDADSGALQDVFTGTTIKHLTRESLSRYQIPLPPINEQKRIADKLDAVLAQVDACRERLDRVPAILKHFRQAVLAAATSGQLTKEWREEHGATWLNAPFEDLLAKEDGAIRRGPFGSSIKKSFFVNNGYKVCEQKNAIQDDADLGDYFIDEAKFKELEGFSVRGGDFIVSCAGTIGRISQLPVGAKPGVINQALMRVRLDGTIVETSYFLLLFRSPEFQAQILEQTQGSAMQNMAAIKVIRQIPIRVPSLEEQREIVLRGEALFAYADRLEARYTTARNQVERLTPALLAQAFRGELVPQDPNDEPAAVLLERILAARTATEHAVGPKQRKGDGRPKASQKAELLILARKDVQDMHRTTPLSASSASSRRSPS